MTTTSKRSIEDWRNQVRAYSQLEAQSRMHAQAKSINGADLQKVMEIVNKEVKDDLARRMISATFQVRTKYEALGEIINKHLKDDPNLAIEIAEAAAGAEVDRGNYLAG